MSQSSPSSGSSGKKPLLSNSSYNVLKHAAAIGLPALTALYFALAQIWHFPNTAEVMATIAAVNVFFGAVMGVSTYTYNNSGAKYVGNIEVLDTGDKKTFSLNLNGDPNEIDQMNEATFRVTSIPAPPPPTTAHGAYIPPSS